MEEKKNRTKKRAGQCLAVFLLIVAGVALYHAGTVKGASNAQPGSVADPLITKSYLEEQLAEVSGSFVRVTLAKGKQIFLHAGAEAVIYDGGGTVLGVGGLVNLTKGELLRKDNAMTRYQLYLSPSDASGFVATANTTVFVSGSYTMK
ncbi:MAG: hypothetical protein IJY09_06755 [Lachnospiraceae bacterium]|nr:hypothetical protein [Lachnospiraceae bacterium]